MTWHDRAILKILRVVGYNYTPPYLHSLHTRTWNTWIIHVLTRYVTPRPFANIWNMAAGRELAPVYRLQAALKFNASRHDHANKSRVSI